MRIALLTCLTVLAAMLGGTVPAATGPAVGSSYYVVTPDPRLCPSPLCGGYWVSLANHARTRCHDGLLRPRCYVASAISTLTRKPMATALPAGALVRGELGARTFGDVGELGILRVAEAWTPLGRTTASGQFYRLQDSGIRCIRAPCYWLRATRLNSGSKSTGSDLDLTATGASQGELDRVQAALRSPSGLLAVGRFVAAADGGRVFQATRVCVRAKQPRA